MNKIFIKILLVLALIVVFDFFIFNKPRNEAVFNDEQLESIKRVLDCDKLELDETNSFSFVKMKSKEINGVIYFYEYDDEKNIEYIYVLDKSYVNKGKCLSK